MPPAEPGDAVRDDQHGGFRLSKEDRLRLPAALAEMFPSQESATDFLTREMRIPAARIPLVRTNESLEDYWRRVLGQLDTENVIGAPYPPLYLAVQERRGKSLLFDWIFRQYWMTDPEADQATAPQVNGCHLIVRTETARTREMVRKWLETEMLAPRRVWANHEMTSFEVNETGVQLVADRINRRYARLLVKVIPPRQPDELIPRIRVNDGGGQELPVPQVPIQLTVAELGPAAARFHPAEASTSTRTTAARSPGGKRRTEYARHVGGGIAQSVPVEGALLQFGISENDRVTIKSVKFQRIRVVFAGASPRWDGSRRGDVRFSQELDEIRHVARLKHIDLAGKFPHATRGHLAEILKLEPDILHVACYGSGAALYCGDDDGDPDSMSATWLADNIAECAGRRLSGIVFRACSGETIGPYFTGVARDVIAHQGLLAQNLARKFTAKFSDELATMPVLRTTARRADVNGSLLIFLPDMQGDS